MSNESFLGGLNILDGMPSRQAGGILYAIEGRTAQLVSQSRQALASYLTEKTAAEKEQAFLSAIAQGRDLPLKPAIQDIERFAPEWSSLVPGDENLRAALARQLGEKYRFQATEVPGLRGALGLDGEDVRESFERQFNRPLESIYSTSTPLPERIHWLSSGAADRLERIPPFWTAYSLTLTETVGGSVLALPIALAGVGPLPGVVLLVILGLVNILTVMGIVEAITRNGSMRYGTAYFGRLVGDYLGRPGSILLVPALLMLNVLILIAYYVGISTSLADITGINSMLWAVLIFLIIIYFLRRESLNATVASALAIGIVNITILLIISALALYNVDIENLRYSNLPFGAGKAFDPRLLELVFGVVLVAYFGHTSAGNAAKVVLRRDPGGRSLIWGNVAAMATAIALYSLWVIAISGAIPSAVLGSEIGTALSPLALRIGGVVSILGIIYVILAMGMGAVHMSFGLFYQVREALPTRSRNAVFLMGAAPAFLLFLFVEWMLFTDSQSFSGMLGIMGVLLLPLMGGIFPILMLLASRRKGDYIPRLVPGFLGHPLVAGLVYVIYLGSVFAYGLFIWEDPVQRIAATSMGFLVLLVTWLIIRQGAFASRAVVEVKLESLDNSEWMTISLVNQGSPVEGAIQFIHPDREECITGSEARVSNFRNLKHIIIELPGLKPRELKVWLHRVTPEGNSEPLTATLLVDKGGETEELKPDAVSGVALYKLKSQLHGLQIELA